MTMNGETANVLATMLTYGNIVLHIIVMTAFLVHYAQYCA